MYHFLTDRLILLDTKITLVLPVTTLAEISNPQRFHPAFRNNNNKGRDLVLESLSSSSSSMVASNQYEKLEQIPHAELKAVYVGDCFQIGEHVKT
jgi:hypothetical protein